MKKMMVTVKDCIELYGTPRTFNEGDFMKLWDVPEEINTKLPTVPNRIYCHKAMIEPLEAAFQNIIDRNLQDELKTWDGCFNIRKKRGLAEWSSHAYGISIDINAAWNRLGREPEMSSNLVKCFTDAGFVWGGNWTRKDGMHFQLKSL